MKPDNVIGVGLLNLHDTFLSASLVKKLMNEAALEKDAETFDTSDRARLERMWVAFLAVLIESWYSQQMKPVVDYIRTKTCIDELTESLRQGRTDGSIDKMI